MTIRQIAEVLKVAPSTVSVVLNSRPGVRPELRDKIKTMLIENGYKIKEPNVSKGSILFVYYKSTNYLAARNDNTASSILSAIEDICHANNYTFTVANATPNTLDSIIYSAHRDLYKGIVLLGTEYYHQPSSALLNSEIPIVVLDGFFPEHPLNTVNIDNSYGTHEALKLLLSNNHPTIGYFKSSIEFGCLRDRKNCIFSSVEQLKLSLKPQYIIEVSQESNIIQKEVAYFLKNSSTIPTAFIADNDIIAVSAIQVFQRFGFKVPEDISIIGFDDSNICTILTPNLSTLRADFNRMAKLATSRLIEIIETGDPKIIKSTVGVSLIKRDTVSPNINNQFIISTGEHRI